MSLAVDVGIGLAFVFALVALICTGLQEMFSAALNLRGKTLWEGVQSMLQCNARANLEAARTPAPEKPASEQARMAVVATTLANDISPPAPAAAGAASQSAPDHTGTPLAAALRVHPLITSLIPDRFGLRGFVRWILGSRPPSSDIGNAKPSYLQASTFATALADKIGEIWKGGSERFDDFGPAVAAMPDSPLKTILQGMVRETRGDPAKLRAAVEAWYEETMVRVGGWYKRRVQVLLLLIGLVVAGAMNIDAIHIAGALATQPGLAKEVANRAADAAVAAKESSASSDAKERAASARNELRDLNLPIGWTGARPVTGMADAGLMFLGWLITALAATFGAPFWFDLINKLVPLRSSGIRPAAAPEVPPASTGKPPGEASEIRTVKGTSASGPEPFRAPLNDYEANVLSAGEIVQIKRMLNVSSPAAESTALDQVTRDAIRKKQQEMGWPATGELSARWVEVLRTGGA